MKFPEEITKNRQADDLNLFNYFDYREYLRDFYQLKKTKTGNYSFAVFSLRAGVKSPNYLKLVMDGKRNLTGEKILAFAKGLGLNELETTFWENLVLFTQAKTAAQRQVYLARLSRTQFPTPEANSKLVREIRDEWDFYSNWYHAAIRELVETEDFEPSPRAIAAKLKWQVSVKEAAESLELLKRLGFLITDENGHLKQKESYVLYGTRRDIANLMVRRFHRATAKLATECLEDDSEQAHEERHFVGVTLGVNRKTLPLIKTRLNEYLRALNAEFTIRPDSGEPLADQVYQINLQLVPLTHSPSKKKVKKEK